MYDKKEDMSVLALSFIPVVIAIGGLVVNFNMIDVAYLLLVASILFKYFRNGIVSQRND